MGIDIGYLDICLLVGYPGTIINTWQRGGRVGRSGRESLIILVAKPDALDQYFMKHPEDLFDGSYEAALLDPHNPYVVKDHLPCAAAEKPHHPPGRPLLARGPEGPPGEAGEGGEAHPHRRRGADLVLRQAEPPSGVNIRSVGEHLHHLRRGDRGAPSAPSTASGP